AGGQRVWGGSNRGIPPGPRARGVQIGTAPRDVGEVVSERERVETGQGVAGPGAGGGAWDPAAGAGSVPNCTDPGFEHSPAMATRQGPWLGTLRHRGVVAG